MGYRSGIFGLLLPIYLIGAPEEGVLADTVYSDTLLGVELLLPQPGWLLREVSQPQIRIVILAHPDEPRITVSLISLPRALGIEGAQDRDRQLKDYLGDRYERLELGEGELAGEEASYLRYEMATDSRRSRVLVWVLRIGEHTLMLQGAAPVDRWEEFHPIFDGVFNTVKFFESAAQKE